jgi:predicted transcriptional regulator
MPTKLAKKSETASEPGEGFAAAVSEGLADLKSGRSIPYDKVRQWLLSWGSKKETPPPECK